MNDTNSCRTPFRRKVRLYQQGTWKTIEDVITDEQRLNIVWQDDLSGERGRSELWAWPHDLAPLALGHVLLHLRPQGNTLARQCSVRKITENEYAVALGAARKEQSPPSPSSLRGVQGGMLFQAMHAFIRAEGQWDGTGCFHRAGVFDPASGRFLAKAEDIGRHNCLDRLAGWSAMQGVSLTECIAFTSARLTASLCAKALRAGFPILVSRSAVTAAAIAMAEERQAALVGFARTDEERLTLFTNPLGRVAADGDVS